MAIYINGKPRTWNNHFKLRALQKKKDMQVKRKAEKYQCKNRHSDKENVK